MNLINIIIPTLISVFLILYFRRTDKRNTQLQTLKNFINASMYNMNKLFQDKEKELLDKTINLDISLKKLDKAGIFINNKLGEINESLKQTTTIHQNISEDLKTARTFDNNINDLKYKFSELSRAVSEFEALSKEINENKIASAKIKNDIEQARVWAETNISEFMKITEDTIAEHKVSAVEQINIIQAEVKGRAEEVEYIVSNTDEQLKIVKERIDGFQDEFAGQLDDREREMESRIDSSVNSLREYQDQLASGLKGEMESRIASYREEITGADELLKDQVKQAKSEFLNDAQVLKQNIGIFSFGI